MINWKVVVGSGATAVVLSLLTGIISGVSFNVLLLRAVMWGIIFCAAGSGVSFLISKYLPELFSPRPADSNANARPNVDIVLPDENPHADYDNDIEESPDFDFSQTQTDEPNRTRRGQPESRPATRDNLVEEVEELGGPLDIPQRRATTASGGLDDAEEAEELPDLDGADTDFSAFGEQGGFQSSAVTDITNISGRSSTVDVLGFQADSEDLAQAIRTALKKDQKG